MNNCRGFFYGIVTSVTFGLIPLFTLPLMREGLLFNSILFYRFIFASVALGVMMIIKKESFAINVKDLPLLAMLAFFYTISAMFLFWGYGVMGAGVATTLHFTYPVFVTLLMFLFFKQRANGVTWMATLLALCGVAWLSLKNAGESVDILGVFVVLLSALGYALYIVAVNKSRLSTFGSRKLAFYVFIFTTLMLVVISPFTGGLQYLPNWDSVFNLLLLAIIPTVISNITLLLAVRNIGSTMTSVLGAMEPVTAVCVGVFVFGETFTSNEALGVILILIAVTIIILNKPLHKSVSYLIKRIRPRHA